MEIVNAGRCGVLLRRLCRLAMTGLPIPAASSRMKIGSRMSSFVLIFMHNFHGIDDRMHHHRFRRKKPVDHVGENSSCHLNTVLSLLVHILHQGLNQVLKASGETVRSVQLLRVRV
jgi:hypothetical protein